MSIRLSGRPSTLLAYTGSQLVITAESPSPPGARLELEVDDESGTARAFRLKVHGCKRRPDVHGGAPSGSESPAFVVLGGVMDLRREARQALEALAAREGTPAAVKGFS